jgi:hypothetical protein
VQETALLIRLLKHTAADSLEGSAKRAVFPLDDVDEREIRWAVDAGLGALLHRATRHCLDRVPIAWRDVLLSADLTARVIHGNRIETANEIIEICQERQVLPTLLKGISISDQYYPVPHLRPMGDIDMLIPAEAHESIESALLRRGYVPQPGYSVTKGAKHGVPLAHPERHVWVELHTALYDEIWPVPDAFDIAKVAAQRVVSTFHGRRVYRLTDELQLLYIASGWAGDLAHYNVEIHPSGIPPLLDVLYLLKASGKVLDHSRLAVGPGSEMAIASLYVMLSYLARHGLGSESRHLSRVLASSQKLVGPVQLRVIHAVLDRYLIGGRPWNLPVPLPVPGRYSVRRQLRKRLRATWQ